MNTSIAEQIKLPGILDLKFLKHSMQVYLTDGRTITIPLAWYPKLSEATREQLKNYEISPSGYGIYWPDLDEDLSVLGFLFPDQSRAKK
ncbi:MAG: DUF2442 domain-containing protein [Thermodesulfobacteriota bacterium]